MDSNQSPDRIAVLIDADNASHRQLQVVLGEVAKYGNPTIKRVYGDWTNDRLSNWAPKLNSLGLRAVHQNAFTKGKNSTDMALVIDAMDLLYDGNVESFALVTSDSDFTALTHRLRESGKAVYVLGTQKAPVSLRNACDKFIDLDVLADADDDSDEETSGAEDAHDAVAPSINLQSALTRALNAVSDDDGWASLPTLGNQLVRTHPSFDPRTFAGPGGRLSTLVADQAYLETSGSGNALRVRLKGAPAARRGKGAERSGEKPGERTADQVVEQVVAELAPAKTSSAKAPARKAAAKKAATKDAGTKDAAAKKAAPPKADPRTAPAEQAAASAEPAAQQTAPEAEAPAAAPARKRAPRKTAAKKAAEKATEKATKAAEAPAVPAPEPEPDPTPVVRVTSRTRSGRPVTRTGATPAS